MNDQNPDHRAQLLDALDFAYCQGLGYDTPEALVAAYDAARGVSGPPPADQTALRQRIAAALAARFTADGDLSQGMRVIDPNDEDDPNPARWVRPGEAADVVMAVLPEQTDRAAEAERPLSPDYEHPECGFHWHGRDGMDIPIRDGQPVCPRCELRRAEKLLAHRERRCQELREECLRRGKNVLARSLKIVALERQLDEVRSQLGAEILRAGQAETELRRVAAEEQPAETQETQHVELRVRYRVQLRDNDAADWKTSEPRVDYETREAADESAAVSRQHFPNREYRVVTRTTTITEQP